MWYMCNVRYSSRFLFDSGGLFIVTLAWNAMKKEEMNLFLLQEFDFMQEKCTFNYYKLNAKL